MSEKSFGQLWGGTMTYRTTAFAIIAGLSLSGCVYDGAYYEPGYAGHSSYASGYGSYDDPEYCPSEETYYPYSRRSYRDDDYNYRYREYRYKKKKRLSKKERKRQEQHARDMEFLNEKLEQLRRWEEHSAKAK